jgi:thymidylate synthase (FAD)
MNAELLTFMGSDLLVVNAARVSFHKESEYLMDESGHDYMQDKDIRLIHYLARHKHELPFAHCQATFRVKAPIFVARQLAKHQVGFVWSEVSRRYVDDEVEFYIPEHWRLRAENKKQGSSKETISEFTYEGGTFSIQKDVYHLQKDVFSEYKILLGSGVAPEMARMILPQNTYTTWIWTGSLLGWSRVWNLRVSDDAQQETREVVEQIGAILQPLFPISWGALTNNDSRTSK